MMPSSCELTVPTIAWSISGQVSETGAQQGLPYHKIMKSEATVSSQKRLTNHSAHQHRI